MTRIYFFKSFHLQELWVEKAAAKLERPPRYVQENTGIISIESGPRPFDIVVDATGAEYEAVETPGVRWKETRKGALLSSRALPDVVAPYEKPDLQFSLD